MATSCKNSITLRGSTEIVTEFFHYGLHSILYQRGLYPPETFAHTQQWGLTMLVSCDKDLQTFLGNILCQVKTWLTDMTVEKLVLVVKEVGTNNVVERWQFDVECDRTVTKDTKREVKDKDIQDGIRAVIRQITASVTFLPLLETPCNQRKVRPIGGYTAV
ncbi:mitotic spindle assembly checkpoint protein MAD2A isoform X2 [Aplysia californica]|uniref:Mitotic spindle assembly checkpoint protein MAD2A isoform X2 n=1 Tax=Aplysia californica TaxID=6500 RepID=A0ABM1AE26_APLCA|nr:mitotic spindle assembly checkpoint protein MAD2A isoform X2 [Aplysia californica]